MPSYYTYLISSLPMLYFGSRPPISFEKFIETCEGAIPQNDTRILKETRTICGRRYDDHNHTLRKWHAFETILRNELVKIRAHRLKRDPEQYLRGDDYADPQIVHIALSACRNPSVTEAESELDKKRWFFLDELAMGHYFDLDFLIVYAIKLCILERWEMMRIVDSAKMLKDTLAKGN